VCRCVGYYSEEDSPSRRLARPLVFCRTESDCPLENGYARPVEGIHVLVDMQKMEVLLRLPLLLLNGTVQTLCRFSLNLLSVSNAIDHTSL
jgi:hypothetical protein